jgi:hypothetical protein
MLRLTEELFSAEPRAAQADYYERALFNHLLASIHPSIPGYVYFTPMRPAHYRVYSQPEKGFWCCVGSGMENPGRYGRFVYARSTNGLFLNLFVASRLEVPHLGLTLRQETAFPDEPRTPSRAAPRCPRRVHAAPAPPRLGRGRGLRRARERATGEPLLHALVLPRPASHLARRRPGRPRAPDANDGRTAPGRFRLGGPAPRSHRARRPGGHPRTESRDRARPGEFLEKRYPLPADILPTAPDGRVTIRFAASSGSDGATVFDVRLLKLEASNAPGRTGELTQTSTQVAACASVPTERNPPTDVFRFSVGRRARSGPSRRGG